MSTIRQAFPNNNLYRAVSDGDLAVFAVYELCARHNDTTRPPPLIRSLSIPHIRSVDELINLVRMFYFVEQVNQHESGNVIVWAKLCLHRDEETPHIGILRQDQEPPSVATQVNADTIMLTGIFSNVAFVRRIVRINTHHTTDFTRDTMYCAYIIYVDEVNEVEEGEVPELLS